MVARETQEELGEREHYVRETVKNNLDALLLKLITQW